MFGLHKITEKTLEFSVNTFFFFGLHLICLPEKSLGRGSSPQLKIGQNWGNITNYPPQRSTKIGTPAGKALVEIYCAAVKISQILL